MLADRLKQKYKNVKALVGTLKADDSKQLDAMKFVASSNARFLEIEIQSGLPESFDQDNSQSAENTNEFFWFQYGDESSRAINHLTERIRAQGIRKIRGTLYAIAGSAAGEQVSLSEIKGTGFLDPKIELFEEESTIESVKGLLGSNTGVGIPIESRHGLLLKTTSYSKLVRGSVQCWLPTKQWNCPINSPRMLQYENSSCSLQLSKN